MQSRIGKKSIAILALTGCLLQGTAIAQVPPKNIPKGQRCVSEGETFQCFDLDDYKELLKADVRYVKCLEHNRIFETKEQKTKIQIFNLKKAIEIQEERTRNVEEYSNQLYILWLEENKKRHEAENEPQYGSWVLWATTGTFAVTTAVLAGMAIAKD